ncbi:MAG: hypothetical protein H6R21_3498 [Proteobacteria bacterium]|nr:hypothetical protein [Pseudomonadota bacterium]RPJ47825.1 MAG: hypothetical protein EHM16_04790 [Betaproteobacteria bacterium]
MLLQLKRMLCPVAMLAALLGAAVPARAELTCEQLVASAQAGIALRDRGASIGQVLAETEKSELRERFRPDELAMIRRALQLTFSGEFSVYELAETCAAGKGGRR